VSQPVLPMLPAGARSVGPSAGLLEGVDGGVVFVFGLATFTYASGDQAGRRLAAVQLVATKAASVAEVASAFGVNTATLWRWTTAFGSTGVVGLVAERPGPRRASKLTDALIARIITLDGEGLTLRQIAAQTGVAPATVRVALGRVSPREQPPIEPTPAATDSDHGVDVDADLGFERGAVCVVEHDEHGADLVVLAAPAARTPERVAARFGDLTEAPVVITQGSQLPLVGLLLALPALEMTGLLPVASEVFTPMRKGFYGLRVTLLMTLFMALLREPRAEGATRLRPADLGRLLGLDRAPEVKRCAASSLSSPTRIGAPSCKPRSADITSWPVRRRSGSSIWTGTSGSTQGPGSCLRPTSPGCGSPAPQRKRPGSATLTAIR